MASNTRVFFAGAGTALVILALGFGGGLMLAKTSLEPTGPSRSVADRLPPVRVILPASADAATPSQAPVQTVAFQDAPQLLPVSAEAQQAAEKQKQASERIERRKAEAEERARRKRYAERKEKREAARLAHQQQNQHPPTMQAGVAFERDDDQSRGGGLFGN
jgi:hypothetical protein